MKKLSLLLVTLLSSGFVFAKLPAPTPEAAAAADLAMTVMMIAATA